jgi:3-hydroxyisobutyrate dehydrogenase-like beta-hydroxyacid dehydrogenase
MLAIGLLGMGRMGAPICRRLVAADFSVTVHDPAEGARLAATAGGADWADSAPAVAVDADILLTVLPGPKELEAAMLAPDGALWSMRRGSTWLDFTSGDPRVSQRIAAAARQREIRSVGAPMGGGPADAAAGRLNFFADGPPADLEAIRPILEQLSEPDGIQWVGSEPGHGQVAKLLANLLWFGQAAAVSESLLLGQARGLDILTLRDTLSKSAGGSRFIDDSTDALFRGDYLESFALRRCVEELETVTELAEDTGTPFEISTHVTALYQEALSEFGDADGELLVAKLLEARAGHLLRPSDRSANNER